MINIYLLLAREAWNAGASSKGGGSAFKNHLRQIGWDMKITDPRHFGIYYHEIPVEPTQHDPQIY